jgi:hypothetical protein
LLLVTQPVTIVGVAKDGFGVPGGLSGLPEAFEVRRVEEEVE